MYLGRRQNWAFIMPLESTSQPATTCSKLTTGTTEQGRKYVQS